MSGHSKWSTIKRQKGVADAKRSSAFSKLARLITIAARVGGKDPSMNFRLRLAIEKARLVNMPNANIERAIAAGAGSDKNEQTKEALYEGFGPGGVAVMIQAITDNPNRTSSELRLLLSKVGGSLGAQHSVGWMFQLRGALHLPASALPAEQKDGFFLNAIEAGAEDLREEESQIVILTTPERLQSVKSWVESQGYSPESAQLEFFPTTTVSASEEDRQKLYQLFEALDSHPDVTDFFSND